MLCSKYGLRVSWDANSLGRSLCCRGVAENLTYDAETAVDTSDHSLRESSEAWLQSDCFGDLELELPAQTAPST